MEQQHRIKKQIIELRVGNTRDVTGLQEQISEIYHQSIVPYINECCNTLSRPEITHKVALLELDIGTINPDYLAAELEEKLKPVLYKQLAEKIEATPHTFSVVQPEAMERSNASARQSGTEVELLTYFIQTGMLPWWAERQDKHTLEKMLEACISTAPDQIKALLTVSVNNTSCLKRLIFHFSDITLLKMAGLIAPQHFSFVKNYWEDLRQMTKAGVFKNISKTKLRLEQWKGLWSGILDNVSGALQQETLVEQQLLYLAARLNTDYNSLIRDITKYIAQRRKNRHTFKSTLPRIIGVIRVRLETDKVPRAALLGARGENTVALSVMQDPETARQLHELNAQLRELYRQEYSEKTQERIKSLQWKIQQLTAADNLQEAVNTSFDPFDEIYIANAGLVLLWPFLSRFFETIGLVKEKTFADETDTEVPDDDDPGIFRERAALLLQYLADGSTTVSEHLLPLNKILCGMDLLQPLHTRLILSDLEKEESENLLIAVTVNNPLWKNLSVEGLQSAYLQREGVLSFRDGGWWLQVEKKPYDITLDRLPWTTGVIKLPWMEHVLYTEW